MVYDIKDKKAIRFIIRKKAGLIKTFELINGKLVAPFKYNQLCKCDWLDLPILPPTNLISLNNPWLAGFIDADGS